MKFMHKKDELIQLKKRNEDELLYRTLCEHNEDGFEIIELLYDDLDKIYDYRWLKVNNAWEKQVGLKAADVIGKKGTEIFKTDGSCWLEKYDKVYKNGTSLRYENYGVETKRWFDCLCVPLSEKKVAILFRDITEKKQVESALKESEQLYRTLFENTEDAFHIVELMYDEDGKPIDYKFIKLNENWEKQTEMKAIDVIGRKVTEVMPSIEPYWIETYDNILKSGKSVRYENYNEGTKKWYNMVGFPYANNQVGALFRDISKEKECEKNSQELIEKLRMIDENKNEFLNMFSHEIRNPMAAAMMSLSLLNSSNSNNSQTNKAIETLNRQLNHLSGIVDDLLDVTRIKTNKVRLNKEIININEVIENAVNDHNAHYDMKGVNLEFELSPITLYIEADNTRIMQVLDNLLSNSIKFTQKGGTTSIKVEKDEKSSLVVITVKDTGIGIPPKHQLDLFDPFIQVDSSLDRTNGGLGLGLAIVKGMIELHEGSVDVYSEGIGKGTLFTIRLPIINETVENKEDVLTQEVKESKTLDILLIDDNKDLTEIMCDMLSYLGYSAEFALNGMDGLQKAKELHPDVIICDIGLPVMNGYDVANNVRNDNNLNGVYLIALSGYAQPEDIERSIKAGFDKHLAKPLSLDTPKVTLNEYRTRN